MERVILHSDCDCFYASCEMKYNPALRNVPMVVGGNEEARHGIVLAANYPAKKFGIKTAETLMSARHKCPGLVCVPVHFDLYQKHSKMLNEIYEQYTDQTQAFGLDENWLDVTGSRNLFGDGEHIAREIQNRVWDELGLTVSIGVSWNKIYSKLGSDLRKPGGLVSITKENYKELVWPLPASDLLNVGKSTAGKLAKMGIYTIGQIANTEPKYLKGMLGVHGYALWTFANGEDDSRVTTTEDTSIVKTIGNSRTTPYDLNTDDSIKITFYQLAESIAARLREGGYICRTVQISVRGNDMAWYTRQGAMPYPCQDSNAIFETAHNLYQKNKSRVPVRNLGVRACGLSKSGMVQMSLLDDISTINKHEEAERAIDRIRERFGFHSIQRGIMYTDSKLSALNPKDDHVIHPVSFFR